MKDGDAAWSNTDVGCAYAVGAHSIVEEALAKAGVRSSAWLNLIVAARLGFRNSTRRLEVARLVGNFLALKQRNAFYQT